jgi:hypothetical protein
MQSPPFPELSSISNHRERAPHPSVFEEWGFRRPTADPVSPQLAGQYLAPPP